MARDGSGPLTTRTFRSALICTRADGDAEVPVRGPSLYPGLLGGRVRQWLGLSPERAMSQAPLNAGRNSAARSPKRPWMKVPIAPTAAVGQQSPHLNREHRMA